MKTCPICKARCFDDMEICYGCMHQFEVAPPVPPAASFAGDEAPQPTAPLCSVADPFEEREEAPTPTPAEVATPTPTAAPAAVPTAASTTFLTPPFSLEDLFTGQEYRLEIILHPCKKEHASAQRRSSCTDER
ncbi:MAG: hypothetical protein RR572_05460 [Raoultibacter sp.]